MLRSLLAWPVARLFNVHRVAPGVYRSAQLYRGMVGLIIGHLKLNSIVNLRGDNPGARWYDNERAACARAGIAHHDLRFSSKRLPDRAALLDLVAVHDGAARPLLMKCSGGADRTSLASGLFLLLDGRPLAEARQQTRFFPYLHRPRREQLWIRGFFDFVEAEDAAGRMREWIATGYDPARFAQFLQGRGQGDAWRA